MASSPPNKLFNGQKGFPTPNAPPLTMGCRVFSIPADEEYYALFMGALYALTWNFNWYKNGDLEQWEAADYFADILDDAYELAEAGQCGTTVPAPYWDDPDGGDADDQEPVEDQPWYGVLIGESTWQEQVEDWFIAAFVAMAATPAAAIAFLTIAPKFRLAWKTANWGAIVKIFLDQVEIGTVDTYSATPDIVTFDVVVPGGMGAQQFAHELWVMHSGEHNPLATPDPNGNFTIQCIRKQLNPEELGVATELRQSTTDPCILEYSIDGGDTWLEAFDYGLCVPPNQPVPTQIIVNPGAPGETFTRSEGDTDAEQQARVDGLCYAVEKVIASMLDSAYQVCQGNATGLNLGGLALGIIVAILIGVEIISGGSLTALVMLALAALLEMAGTVASLDCNKYLSTDVRDELVCLMFQNLMNQAVTLENFRAAFDGVECLTGDAAEVGAVLEQMLQSLSYGQRLFDSFLNVIGEAESAALQGATISTCICSAATWQYFWNFQQEQVGGWHITEAHMGPGNIPSIFYPNCGFANPSGVSGYLYNCDTVNYAIAASCQIEVFIPDGCTLEVVRMTGSNLSPGALYALYVDSDCYAQTDNDIFTFGTPYGPGQHTIQMIIGSGAANTPLSRKIYGIGMSGDGFNPFAGCDVAFSFLPDCP